MNVPEENIQNSDFPTQVFGARSWKFHAFLALGVAVLSFAYGLTVGVRRQLARASAVQQPTEAVSSLVSSALDSSIELPPGVVPIPMGDDTAINGKAVDIAMFVSERTPAQIIDDAVSLWKSKGVFAVGMGGNSRAVGIGIDRAAGKRFSAVAWIVPPTLRAGASRGLPVQGMIAATDGDRVVDTSAIGSRGEIEGVPIRPGGQGGAIFSAMDPGGRSETGAYTNPGTVEDNVEFYRRVLVEKGWTENNRSLPPFESDNHPDVASLSFRQADHELTLLFSQLRDGSAFAARESDKTVVTVILGPRLLG